MVYEDCEVCMLTNAYFTESSKGFQILLEMDLQLDGNQIAWYYTLYRPSRRAGTE